ncbi:MAG: hypothetical protein ACJ8KX_06130, partial [Chthoniobacterales bacterium]
SDFSVAKVAIASSNPLQQRTRETTMRGDLEKEVARIAFILAQFAERRYANQRSRRTAENALPRTLGLAKRRGNGQDRQGYGGRD